MPPNQDEPTGWELRRAMDDLRQDVKDGFSDLGQEMTNLRSDFSTMRNDFVSKDVFEQNKQATDHRLNVVESAWRRLGPAVLSIAGLLISVGVLLVAIYHK